MKLVLKFDLGFLYCPHDMYQLYQILKKKTVTSSLAHELTLISSQIKLNLDIFTDSLTDQTNMLSSQISSKIKLKLISSQISSQISSKIKLTLISFQIALQISSQIKLNFSLKPYIFTDGRNVIILHVIIKFRYF